MTVLVTGGGGFLGRHIVHALLAHGARVRVLGRRPYPDLAALGVETLQGDLCEIAKVQEACSGVESLFHVAALAGVWGPFERYYRANVLGTQNLLDAAREGGVRRFVATSTPSVVYGRKSIEGGDEHLPYPTRYLTHYAQTKAEAERRVLTANTPTLATCSLRPHLIWGPGDTNLTPRIIARAKTGRLRRIGSGKNRVSVAYVENVAAAHLAAWQHLAPNSPVAGEAFFINEPEPVACWDFIDRLLIASDCSPVTHAIPFPLAYATGALLEGIYHLLGREGEPPMTRFVALQLATSHWFRTEKASRLLSWHPSVSIEAGLNRLRASSAPREGTG